MDGSGARVRAATSGVARTRVLKIPSARAAPTTRASALRRLRTQTLPPWTPNYNSAITLKRWTWPTVVPAKARAPVLSARTQLDEVWRRDFGGGIPSCREAFESHGSLPGLGISRACQYRAVTRPHPSTKVLTIPMRPWGQVAKSRGRASPVQPTPGIIVRERELRRDHASGAGGRRFCRQGQRPKTGQSIGSAHDLRPICYIQFLHDPADMNFHGAFA